MVRVDNKPKRMKYLVSFLGTGPFTEKGSKRNYSKTLYKFEEVEEEHEFVSLFLSKQLKIDKLIIIGTHKSMWESLYINLVPDDKQKESIFNNLIKEIDKNYDGSWNEDVFINLQNEINENSNPKIKLIIVKFGLNEDEIKYNIKKIIDEFYNEFFKNNNNQKIDLNLDITHSFRSLPIIFQQVIQYFSLINEEKINYEGIYYAMHEVIKEIGYAPIINLSQVAEIGKWANAAYSFKNFGNGYFLADLIQTSNPSESAIIKDFSDTINFNLIFHVKGKISQLNGILNKQYPTLGEVFIPNVIKDFTNNFINIDKDSVFQLNLAKWQFRKKRYGLSVIILYEAIISWICEQKNLSTTSYKDRENAKELLNEYPEIKKIFKNYKINQIRNAVAHQLQNNFNVETAIRNLERALNKFSTIINQKLVS